MRLKEWWRKRAMLWVSSPDGSKGICSGSKSSSNRVEPNRERGEARSTVDSSQHAVEPVHPARWVDRRRGQGRRAALQREAPPLLAERTLLGAAHLAPAGRQQAGDPRVPRALQAAPRVPRTIQVAQVPSAWIRKIWMTR